MNDAPALTAPTLSAPAGTDTAAARDMMVDGQVRPNKVIDPRIIRAMRTLPRERFVPPHLAARAYVDEDVPLPGGRCLMEPMVIARLVQMLRVRDGERGLVVAAGAGYGAALLDACGGVVTALEEDAALLALARAVLPAFAPRVTVVEGPIAAGWAAGAPYDFILIEGSVGAIPNVLAAQLAPMGRLAAVVTKPGRSGPVTPGAGGMIGQGVLAEPVHVGAATTLRAQPFFDCATPMLPPFMPQAGFVF
jgi:protein-L-isoaspartate(D-aspartate) O-methyltransferase